MKDAPTDTAALQAQTIRDFGEQWTTYSDSSGYFGSPALFDDIFHPFVTTADLKGMRIAEIGAGTGRFVEIFLAAGASHVIALEPSASMEVIRRNVGARADLRGRVECVEATGDLLAQDASRDYVFSIGVLHHIPDPRPVCRAALGALRPGGTFAVWVYGREGNGAYLTVFNLLHTVTKRMPHPLLAATVWTLGWGLDAYIAACRIAPLPLRGYAQNVLAKLTRDKRRLVLYDQLNPAYARYYSGEEAWALLTDAGFTDVRLHHRHGYSWTVLGRRPA